MLPLMDREGIVMLSLTMRDRYEMKNLSLWIVDKSFCTVTNHNMRLYNVHAFPHKPVKNIYASPDGEGRHSGLAGGHWPFLKISQNNFFVKSS